MRILLAPDKFKGCLSAREVAEHIATGVRESLPAAEVNLLPVADGGEGTAQIICEARRGEWISARVRDARGRPMDARFAWIADARLAVLDLTEVAGLSRLDPHERDPTTTTTFGLGELLLAADRHHATNIIVGLGGSATNDGGFGMARALGVKFFDEQGAQLTAIRDLARLHRLEQPAIVHIRTTDQRCRWLRGSPVLAEITAAADVTNPLLGPDGATRTFAAQKGADARQIELLERALTQLADVVARDLRCDPRDQPGSGAAGGLGFGLMAFCNATVRSGFDVVAEQIGLEAAVRNADVVITAEGRLDAQTLHGKAPAGVARLARRSGKRVYAIVGASEGEDARAVFNGVLTLTEVATQAKDPIRDARELLRQAGARLVRELCRR